MPKLSISDLSCVAVLDSLSAPVWIFDLDEHRIWWGNKAAQVFWRTGSLEELIARDFSSDSASVRRRLRRMYLSPDDPQLRQAAWTLYPWDEPVSVTVQFQPILIDGGRSALLVEITGKRDIGPDLQAARIGEAVRYSGAILSMFSLSGVLLAQNAASFECYGTQPDDAEDLIQRLGGQDEIEALFDAVRNADVFEAEIDVQTQNGPRTHRIRGHRGRDPATGATAAVLIEYDISDLVHLRRQLSDLNANLEQRVAEGTENLKISEERFSLAMQGANDGLWDHNVETGETYLSPRWLEMLGFTEEDAPPDIDTFMALVHPDDRERVGAVVIRPSPNATRTPEVEFRVRHRNNSWIDILARAFLTIRDGEVVRIVGTNIDISERKTSERMLSRLRDILFEGSEALPLGVAYYDHKFELVMCNSLYRTMLPISSHLLVPGVPFRDIVRNSAANMASQFGYDDPEEYVRERIRGARIKRQRWLHEQTSGRTVIATEIPTSGNGVISLIEDVTEERTRQKQLQQAQKMEAIGQLTGGVAHDFNNLLAVIMGNLELLQLELDAQDFDSNETSMLIEAGIKAVKHGADLTRSMLAYARKARLDPTVLDLNQTVRETERWMRRTIPSNIEFNTLFQEGLWPVRLDQSSLQSALLNLIVNARDAMETGGKLTIKTANVTIDGTATRAGQENLPAGDYVLVSLTDNGPGIPPEIIDQIYDPFFTTKSVGQGTGLGLSMVEGFVRQSGGMVEVESKLDEGACFTLYFPAVSKESLDRDDAAEARKRAKAQAPHARLLLAEDQPEVMAVLKRTLVSAGYDVTTAVTGDIAFELFKADPEFDMVLTDIVMPGRLQGPDLAKECRLLRPQTPFVFLSGYASEATAHGNGLSPGDIRLMKPVSRKGLLETVEAGLNRGR